MLAVKIDRAMDVYFAELKGASRALIPHVQLAMREALKPAIEKVRQSALDTLPRSGGLNEWVADSVFKSSVLTGRKTAGVVLRGRKQTHDLGIIDRGRVRHPVFGNDKSWAHTDVKAGFWTDPLTAMKPDVEEACVHVMNDIARIAGFK